MPESKHSFFLGDCPLQVDIKFTSKAGVRNSISQVRVGLVLMVFIISPQPTKALTTWKSFWQTKMGLNSLLFGIGSRWWFAKKIFLIAQVGPPPGFQLTLGPYRQNCSTLPDRMSFHSCSKDIFRSAYMRFTAKWVENCQPDSHKITEIGTETDGPLAAVLNFYLI